MASDGKPFGAIFMLGKEMSPQPAIRVPAKVVRVIDGDTVEVEVSTKITVRLLDCWAPERFTEDGKQSKKAAEMLLPPDSECMLDVPLGGHDQLHDVFSFGRVLGNLFTESFGCIAKRLVETGYAKASRD